MSTSEESNRPTGTKLQFNGSLWSSQGCSFETYQVSQTDSSPNFYLAPPLLYALIKHYRLMLTLNESVSVSPTPAATVSGAPTATGTTQNNDQSEFKQSLIGTSATLGSLVVALVGLLIGWKQLRRMKAPKLGSARRDSPELSSPDAEPKETHHESSPAVTSNPNSSSPASAVSTA